MHSIRTETMWVVHFALGLTALYAAVITAMYFAQTWLLFQPRLPERRRFSLPHRPSIWGSRPMTAKASRACESDLWERRLRVRQRWSASGGTLGTRGQWPSPCTRFFPIAMSLRSTTAAMRRAAAGQAQAQCYRIRL